MGMNKHRRRMVNDIVAIVVEEYGLSSTDIFSDDRHLSVAEARGLCYAVCRATTRLSFPEIGDAMGRDHSTVLQVSRKLMRKMKKDPQLAKTFEVCRLASLEAQKSRRVA
jgi:chromosomal replication initiator protein